MGWVILVSCILHCCRAHYWLPQCHYQGMKSECVHSRTLMVHLLWHHISPKSIGRCTLEIECEWLLIVGTYQNCDVIPMIYIFSWPNCFQACFSLSKQNKNLKIIGDTGISQEGLTEESQTICLLQCRQSINQIRAVLHLLVLSVVDLVYSWQICSSGLLQWAQHLVYDFLIYPPWYQLIRWKIVARSNESSVD